MRDYPNDLVDRQAKEYAITNSISEELKLNGRQISNGILLNVNQCAADADPINSAFQTAVSLARSDGARLSVRHFKVVFGMWRDTRDYMRDIEGSRSSKPPV